MTKIRHEDRARAWQRGPQYGEGGPGLAQLFREVEEAATAEHIATIVELRARVFELESALRLIAAIAPGFIEANLRTVEAVREQARSALRGRSHPLEASKEDDRG